MKSENIFYIVVWILMLCIAWGVGYFILRGMENIRVVEVEPGVRCAVTNLNASIDCWQVAVQPEQE